MYSIDSLSQQYSENLRIILMWTVKSEEGHKTEMMQNNFIVNNDWIILLVIPTYKLLLWLGLEFVHVVHGCLGIVLVQHEVPLHSCCADVAAGVCSCSGKTQRTSVVLVRVKPLEHLLQLWLAAVTHFLSEVHSTRPDQSGVQPENKTKQIKAGPAWKTNPKFQSSVSRINQE